VHATTESMRNIQTRHQNCYEPCACNNACRSLRSPFTTSPLTSPAPRSNSFRAASFNPWCLPSSHWVQHTVVSCCFPVWHLLSAIARLFRWAPTSDLLLTQTRGKSLQPVLARKKQAVGNIPLLAPWKHANQNMPTICPHINATVALAFFSAKIHAFKLDQVQATNISLFSTPSVDGLQTVARLQECSSYIFVLPLFRFRALSTHWPFAYTAAHLAATFLTDACTTPK